MALSCHGFCKRISYLQITGYMWKSNDSLIYSFSDIMTVHFNVFGPFMINRIGSNLNSACVVSVERSGIRLRKSNSASKPRSQTISEQAVDIARYSDSVEDFETRSCFLIFQDIKESPRNMHQPETE